MLADRLIAAAFSAHVRDGGSHPPWGWADVHPVGSLEIPRLGVQRYVLSGASGSSLAFGLGHVDGTGTPNGTGNCVLAGHRDTRFAFLKELRVGDAVTLTTRAGTRTWTVESLGVVDDTILVGGVGRLRFAPGACHRPDLEAEQQVEGGGQPKALANPEEFDQHERGQHYRHGAAGGDPDDRDGRV